MQAKGYSPDSRGVAEVYRRVARTLVVDGTDKDFDVRGMEIKKTNTIMVNEDAKKSLAQYVLEI